MATLYLDFEDLLRPGTTGNNANAGTSFANRRRNLDSTGINAALLTAGDTIRVKASPTPAGTAGDHTWTNSTATITRAAAVTVNIDMASVTTGWTAATANITFNTDTFASVPVNGDFATASLRVIVAAGFATGKMAHKQITTVDLSGYRLINFIIRASIAVAANTLRVDLCSDTTGNTVVDSFTIVHNLLATTPYIITLPSNGNVALGASIQSVSLHALLDPGTVNINIANIFVSKISTADDCLTLHTCVSKTNVVSNIVSGFSDDLALYRVTGVSANGLTLYLGYRQLAGTNTRYNFICTTQTVATYYWNPIIMNPNAVVSGACIAIPQEAGTSETVFNAYEGGWNTTDMSTQTGVTLVSSPNAAINFLDLTDTANFSTFNRFWTTGFSQSFRVNGSNLTYNLLNNWVACWCNVGYQNTSLITQFIEIQNCAFYACNAPINCNRFYKSVVENCFIYWCGPAGQFTDLGLYGGYVGKMVISCTQSIRLGGGLHTTFAGGSNISYLEIKNPTFTTLSFCDLQGIVVVNKLITTGVLDSALFGRNVGSSTTQQGGTCISLNHQGTIDNRIEFYAAPSANDNKIRVLKDLSVLNGTSTYSRRIVQDAAANITPVPRAPFVPLGTFRYVSGVSQTITVPMRRTATRVLGRLIIRDMEVPGVATVETDFTTAINTWANASITFTPTESGIGVFGVLIRSSDTTAGDSLYIDEQGITGTGVSKTRSYGFLG